MAKATRLHQWLNAIYRRVDLPEFQMHRPKRSLDLNGCPAPGCTWVPRPLLPAGLPLLTAEQRLEWCHTLITHPLLQSESGKFSAWCSAVSDTCRTGKAPEHGNWICSGNGGGKQLPPIPHTAWTPFALEHTEVINLPKTSSPALDESSLHYFLISTSLSRKV